MLFILTTQLLGTRRMSFLMRSYQFRIHSGWLTCPVFNHFLAGTLFCPLWGEVRGDPSLWPVHTPLTTETLSVSAVTLPIFSIHFFFFFVDKIFFIIIIFFYYFTILYWFCHTSTCICHGCTCVPHPEPPSHLPPHTIPSGHPHAPAPSFLYPASNLDRRFVSYMILYMF